VQWQRPPAPRRGQPARAARAGAAREPRDGELSLLSTRCSTTRPAAVWALGRSDQHCQNVRIVRFAAVATRSADTRSTCAQASDIACRTSDQSDSAARSSHPHARNAELSSAVLISAVMCTAGGESRAQRRARAVSCRLQLSPRAPRTQSPRMHRRAESQVAHPAGAALRPPPPPPPRCARAERARTIVLTMWCAARWSPWWSAAPAAQAPCRRSCFLLSCVSVTGGRSDE
jgi:hypothetical protein